MFTLIFVSSIPVAQAQVCSLQEGDKLIGMVFHCAVLLLFAFFTIRWMFCGKKREAAKPQAAKPEEYVPAGGMMVCNAQGKYEIVSPVVWKKR